MRSGDAALLRDRYELHDVVGAGGMAVVWAAHDIRLGRKVAVKQMKPELARDPGMRARFEAEGRAVARLADPHVVQVYDIGEHDGAPFLVMEFLEGPTVADTMRRGPLGDARARRIAIGIARGLACAHREGIVHRDVKPTNVVLVDDEPVVTDFGIAKVVEGLDRETTELVLGTPAYLAPECFAGLPATPRSDVYSAGVLLREMVTGSRQAHGPHARALPPALATVVERATAVDPDARYADGAELARALTDTDASVATVGGDDATVGGDDTDATMAVAPIPPAAAAAAAPTAVASAAVAGHHERTAVLPTPARPGRPPRRRRRRRGLLVLLAVALAVAALGAVLGGTFNGDDAPAGPDTPASTVPTTVAPTSPPTTAAVVVPPRGNEKEGGNKGSGKGNGKGKD